MPPRTLPFPIKYFLPGGGRLFTHEVVSARQLWEASMAFAIMSPPLPGTVTLKFLVSGPPLPLKITEDPKELLFMWFNRGL